MVADYLGNVLADAGDTPGCIESTISLEKLQRYRTKFPAWKDADTFELVDSPE
jgi:predicted amidohydrolase